MASEQASGSSEQPTAREPKRAVRTIQTYTSRCKQCAWQGSLPTKTTVHVMDLGHTVQESRESLVEPAF